jgi:hypothetical protein
MDDLTVDRGARRVRVDRDRPVAVALQIGHDAVARPRTPRAGADDGDRMHARQDVAQIGVRVGLVVHCQSQRSCHPSLTIPQRSQNIAVDGFRRQTLEPRRACEDLEIQTGDGGDTVTTDQQGRVNPDERIDEAGPRQGRCELPASLDEKSRDAALTQRCERSGKIDAPQAISADFDDHDTAVVERLPPGSIGRRKSYDPGRHLFGVGNQASIGAYGEMSVDDDPYR